VGKYINFHNERERTGNSASLSAEYEREWMVQSEKQSRSEGALRPEFGAAFSDVK
jgi:hypothetical protein